MCVQGIHYIAIDRESRLYSALGVLLPVFLAFFRNAVCLIDEYSMLSAYSTHDVTCVAATYCEPVGLPSVDAALCAPC